MTIVLDMLAGGLFGLLLYAASAPIGFGRWLGKIARAYRIGRDEE